MTTYEMFNRLVQDARNISEVISELINQGFSNSDVLLLKEYLDKTHIEGNELILPLPFTNVSTTDSWKKVVIYVFEYVCNISFIAFQVYSERSNRLTAEIFSKASRMLKAFKEFSLEGDE